MDISKLLDSNLFGLFLQYLKYDEWIELREDPIIKRYMNNHKWCLSNITISFRSSYEIERHLAYILINSFGFTHILKLTINNVYDCHLSQTQHIIKKCKKMKYLEFSQDGGIRTNYFRTIDLPNIKEIKLDGFYLYYPAMPNLNSFKSLKKVHITNEITYIRSIDGIKELNNLEELYVEKIYNLGVKELDNFTKLKKLGIFGGSIEEIEGLDKLIKLEELDLSKNMIRKIEGLDKLVKLKKLNLCRNQIEKIENLENLKQLTSLNLSHNKINKIENLEHLKQLTLLNLSYTNIVKLENLESLDNLKEINLTSSIEMIKIGKKRIKLRD